MKPERCSKSYHEFSWKLSDRDENVQMKCFLFHFPPQMWMLLVKYIKKKSNYSYRSKLSLKSFIINTQKSFFIQKADVIFFAVAFLFMQWISRRFNNCSKFHFVWVCACGISPINLIRKFNQEITFCLQFEAHRTMHTQFSNQILREKVKSQFKTKYLKHITGKPFLIIFYV